MQRSLSLVLIFSLLLHPAAWGAPDSGAIDPVPALPPETVAVELTIAPHPLEQPSAELLRQTFHEAHEAFETEDEEQSFARRWIQKLNYPKMILNVMRWYMRKSGGLNFSDHMGNIAASLIPQSFWRAGILRSTRSQVNTRGFLKLFLPALESGLRFLDSIRSASHWGCLTGAGPSR